MQAVVDLVKKDGKAFGADPRGGPWASVIKSDADFASRYAQMNVDDYKLIVAGWARTMFDRDTAPGAEPEDLLRCKLPALVVPGNDAFHATSAARYLHECLPNSQYWDVSVAEQTEEATAKRMLEFLGSV
jgi:pimeloyl-ACP methyl ester carboxylesterase